MKRMLMTITMALGLLATGHVCAQEAAAPAATAPAATEFTAKLAGLNYAKGTANPTAEYYVLLCSASWCGPCRREMPEIAKIYPEMKKAGWEIILVSYDRKPDVGVKFATDNGAAFPVVMRTDAGSAGLSQVAGVRGIPTAVVVDREGKVLVQGHGHILTKWKTLLNK